MYLLIDMLFMKDIFNLDYLLIWIFHLKILLIIPLTLIAHFSI